MIKKTLVAVAVSASFLTLSGCASESTISEVSQETGETQAFSASRTDVVAASVATFAELGLNLKDTKEANGATTLVFSKPVSAFSWGEVGKVVVQDQSGGVAVTVVASPRTVTSIFATTQATFAQQIFAGISAKL